MSDEKRFADEAGQPPQTFVRELWYLVVTNRRWWLAPIVIAIAILGALVMLSGTGAAPFIYTLF